MRKVFSEKLRANVVECVDLDAHFKAPSLKGLVAFDVDIERGVIVLNREVVLASKSEREVVTVKGIELAEPKKVRALCSKPKTIQIPLADDCEWTLNDP
jgi:hypothetical protein